MAPGPSAYELHRLQLSLDVVTFLVDTLESFRRDRLLIPSKLKFLLSVFLIGNLNQLRRNNFPFALVIHQVNHVTELCLVFVRPNLHVEHMQVLSVVQEPHRVTKMIVYVLLILLFLLFGNLFIGWSR